MSNSNEPGGVAPEDPGADLETANRYLEQIRAIMSEAVSRHELEQAAHALARGYAEVIYGCNSLAVAGDMMRVAGSHLVEIAADPSKAAAAETRPEGATLQ